MVAERQRRQGQDDTAVAVFAHVDRGDDGERAGIGSALRARAFARHRPEKAAGVEPLRQADGDVCRGGVFAQHDDRRQQGAPGFRLERGNRVLDRAWLISGNSHRAEHRAHDLFGDAPLLAPDVAIGRRDAGERREANER